MSGFFHCRDFLYLRDLSTFIEVGKKSEILRLRALNDVLLMIKTHAVSSVYKNYFLALYIIFSILPQILQVKAQLVLVFPLADINVFLAIYFDKVLASFCFHVVLTFCERNKSLVINTIEYLALELHKSGH